MDNATSTTQNIAASSLTPLRGVLLSPWLYRMIRVAIAVLFLWSGLNKVIDARGFAAVIDAFGLIPETWVMPVAFGLPILELVAGLGLLLDVTGSLTLITGLLILFMAILGYGIALGLDVDCGCFGPEDPEAKAFHGLRSALYRDFLVMAGILYLYGWRYRWGAKPVRLLTLLKPGNERRNR